ncbi:MAG TPA: ATP-binding protein [Candidatus Limnocylindrales bacterium]|nr:ATP-binding protein [Candidatus Limnocylindrales bacterium]
MDIVPGGVLTLSRDLRILAVNRGISVLAGRPTEELVGRLFDSILTASSRILFQTHVYPALEADGRVEEVFLTMAPASGESLPVLLNATRTAGDDGQVVYEALIVRILARARWERELLALTRQLEEQRGEAQRLTEELAATADDLAARYAEEQRKSQLRDVFMGVVSHELRTPITTIFGLSRIVRQRLDRLQPAELAEHLADLEFEADRMRRLTEDLLVLSRAEAGRLLVDDEPLLMGHLAGRVIEAEQQRAPSHTFVLEMEEHLPLVAGEELYVEQVLGNLLSNAVKYSPAGTVVTARLARQDGGVAVRVLDQGPGIGEQPADRLFEVYYRAPEAVRVAGGAGIGLFVCRALVEAMGGRVWAAPSPSAPGAEFGFWLPVVTDD